jgi:ubiquinone/menaquinone biosynthesis C-methylase UbiE
MGSVKTSGTDAVREMYDAEAESYSTMMDSEIKHPLYVDTLKRLQNQISDIPGVLIDAPCGSGHMLAMYRDDFDGERSLLGIDLSPQMVAITSKRLGSSAEVVVGDIRKLDTVASGSAAAVINHFAFHHLDSDGVVQAIVEWHRVLCVGGQLVIGAWEGAGAIDYGDEADLVAVKHSADDLEKIIRECGFSITRKVVEPDEDLMMDAVYIEGVKE